MEIKINGKGIIAALILSAGFVSAEYVSVIDSSSVKYTSAPEATFDSPIGSVIMWGAATPPAGWLEMNGQSTSGYPELTIIYGAILPDLRGQFVRGWDNGAGLDSGRNLLSNQDWAIENITGTLPIPLGHDGRLLSYGQTGAFYANGSISGNSAEGTNTRGATVNKFDSSRVVKTANETRPTNISLMYIVKAE